MPTHPTRRTCESVLLILRGWHRSLLCGHFRLARSGELSPGRLVVHRWGNAAAHMVTSGMLPNRSSNKSGSRRGALRDLPCRRIGLVLGAGGATAMAFHAGTLLALSNDFGGDPREASTVVGTSAGSVLGTLLRSGLSADDVASWGASVAPAPGGERF